MCFLEEMNCDPKICPYAKGFFTKINEAIKDIYLHEKVYDLEMR